MTPDEVAAWTMFAAAYAAAGEKPVVAALRAKMLLEERKKVTGGKA